jgi:hypothetical protein
MGKHFTSGQLCAEAKVFKAVMLLVRTFVGIHPGINALIPQV